MKRKELLKAVKAEAIALKKYATKKELDKLDYYNLDPHDVDRCIYGQMAGYCNSKRAVELLNKCNVAIFNGGQRLNTYPTGFGKHQRDENYVTALEDYIMKPNANNKYLIDFLKGKKDKLKLKKL